MGSPREIEDERSLAGASDTLRSLLSSAPHPERVLSYLVDAVVEHDATLLDDLERTLATKRRIPKKGDRIGIVGHEHEGIFLTVEVFAEHQVVSLRLQNGNGSIEGGIPWSMLIFLDPEKPMI